MPRMTHPNLDAEIDVPNSAVHVHARSGWVLVDEAQELPEPDFESTDTESPESEED